MSFDVIGSILSFVPKREYIPTILSHSVLPKISLLHTSFNVYDTSNTYTDYIPEIYRAFEQENFENLIRNLNINPQHLFIHAVHRNMINIVIKLLQNPKVDPNLSYCFGYEHNLKNRYEFRAIHHASYLGWCDMVTLLLKDPRVDPNAIDLHWNAAIFAIQYGRIKVLKILLEDPRTTLLTKGVLGKHNNFLTIKMAIRAGNYDIIQMLLKDSRIIITKKVNKFALSTSVNPHRCNWKIIELIISDTRFDLSIKDNRILRWARAKHKDNIIEKLLKIPRIKTLDEIPTVQDNYFYGND